MRCVWLVWICTFITVVAANGTGGEKSVMVQDPNEMTAANGTSGEETVNNPVCYRAAANQHAGGSCYGPGKRGLAQCISDQQS